MKKILVFFMLLLSLTSLAEEYLAVISKDGYANLREEASTKSKILKKVDNSYTIVNLEPVEDKDNNWYWVIVEKGSPKDGYDYGEGYIHKSQLGIHPETYITSSKDEYVNVRSKASSSSKILHQLPINNYVIRYPEKTEGDWYYIGYTFDSGAPGVFKGYIHKSQLKKFKK